MVQFTFNLIKKKAVHLCVLFQKEVKNIFQPEERHIRLKLVKAVESKTEI